MTATVRDAHRATPRTRLLQLDLAGARFAFAAGQAVLAGRPGNETRTPYSIASAPSAAAHGTLELLVGADGAFGEAGVEPLTLVGARLAIEGPLGSFGVPAAAESAPLLLVAGGTGIAPIRSVMLDRLERPQSAVMSLVYSARAVDEFAFGDELETLRQAGRLALHCTVTRDDAPAWPGRTGRVDDSLLAAAWPGGGAWALVCGPGPFVNDVSAALGRLGIDPARVVVER